MNYENQKRLEKERGNNLDTEKIKGEQIDYNKDPTNRVYQDILFSDLSKNKVDKILKGISKFKKIERVVNDNDNQLVNKEDKYLGIDGRIITDKDIYTFQDKTRRNKYKSFQDLQIEYMSSTKYNVKGEYFNGCYDIIIHSYIKDNGEVDELRIFDYKIVKKYIENNFNNLQIRKNNNGGTASFLNIPFKNINHCIIASYFSKNKKYYVYNKIKQL